MTDESELPGEARIIPLARPARHAAGAARAPRPGRSPGTGKPPKPASRQPAADTQQTPTILPAAPGRDAPNRPADADVQDAAPTAPGPVGEADPVGEAGAVNEAGATARVVPSSGGVPPTGTSAQKPARIRAGRASAPRGPEKAAAFGRPESPLSPVAPPANAASAGAASDGERPPVGGGIDEAGPNSAGANSAGPHEVRPNSAGPNEAGPNEAASDDAGEAAEAAKPGHRPGAVRAGRTGRTRLTRVAADPETPATHEAANTRAGGAHAAGARAARPEATGPGSAGDDPSLGAGGGPVADPAGLERALAGMLAFLRRRITGDYEVDEMGFDADLTEHVVAPLLRPVYRSYFRVETRGLENVPDTGGALVVANHSGTLPIDALMAAMALLDHHPAHRYLRMLAADLVFSVPFLAPIARKTGNTLACQADAERLLSKGELVGVWPEGFKGVGKPFSERYKLQRFGRGGFVSAALRAGVPIIPCTIVGAEEIYPMLGNARTAARLLGLPYFPLTPTFPWFGAFGMVPLPSKWLIEFGEPVPTDHLTPAAADDPMLVFELTDRIRETIQHTLYGLLMQRRSVFF